MTDPPTPTHGILDHRLVAIETDHAALNEIDVADELRDPTRLRPFINLGWRCHLHDAATIHHRDSIGERHRFGLIMRDNDEGRAETRLQFHQLELGLLAQFPVQRCHRFVEQEHIWIFCERPRERHALALAARELVGPSATKTVELDEGKHFFDARGDGRPAEAVLAQPERDIPATLDAEKGHSSGTSC